MIHEPAVALTDYAIAIESAVLSVLVVRSARVARGWFALFFAFIALAAVTGGTVHGFVPDESGAPYAILWRATLISIGATAVAGALGAAYAGWPRSVQRVTLSIAFLASAIYLACVLFVTQKFVTTMYIYLPGSLFLLVTLLAMSSRPTTAQRSRTKLRLGAAGLLLTFVAAAVQQSSLALGALDHNAIYHLIQAVALALIYVGVGELTSSTGNGADQWPAPKSAT